MADEEETKLYAQFDNDEHDGKLYRLGDEIDAGIDKGIRAYLIGIGRISSTKPAAAEMPGGDNIHMIDDKPVGDMTRPELERAFLAAVPLHEASDDQLREAISRFRDGIGGGFVGAVEPDEPYDLLKDQPLDSLTVKELDIVGAFELGADYPAKGSKAEKGKAIADKRALPPQDPPPNEA